METYLTDILQCPACGGGLRWEIEALRDSQIETATATCRQCGADYPVRDGIGLFLTPDLDRRDLWEEADSGLRRFFQANPEVERELMETDADRLAPADRFYRAMWLEEQGDFAGARRLDAGARSELYTSEYLDCLDRTLAGLLAELPQTNQPVVDLASGRGALIEPLLQAGDHPLVVTDFSPRVLRRNRRWLESEGRADAVSLLAFDARRTPFQDGAVEIMTTMLGLANIQDPANLLRELRRTLSGRLLAVTHFYPPEDGNAPVIHELGLEGSLYRERVAQALREAGFASDFASVCRGQALPTPEGVILAGARVDGLPVEATELEWCVLVAE